MSKTTKILLTIAAIALFIWYMRRDNNSDDRNSGSSASQRDDGSGSSGNSGSSASQREEGSGSSGNSCSSASQREEGSGSSGNGGSSASSSSETPSQPNYDPNVESPVDPGEGGNWIDPIWPADPNEFDDVEEFRYEGYDDGTNSQTARTEIQHKTRIFAKFNPIDRY